MCGGGVKRGLRLLSYLGLKLGNWDGIGKFWRLDIEKEEGDNFKKLFSE